MNDKLPTAEETLNQHLSGVYNPFGHPNLKSSFIAAIESHTAAHTEGLREKLRIETQKAKAFGHALDIATKDEIALRERVKELEDVIRRSRNRLGNILSDDDLTDEALREHSERLLPSIHDDLNRVIYKEEMK